MSASLLYLLVPVGVGASLYVIRKLRELQWGWVRNNAPLRGKVLVCVCVCVCVCVWERHMCGSV